MTDQQVISSILTYLHSLKSNQIIQDAESLDVAIECLTTATGIPSATQPAKHTLTEIYQKGLEAFEGKSNLNNDERFNKFVGTLKEKGFFNDTKEGSSEYEQRMKMAREKFQSKFSTTDANTAASTPAQPSEQQKSQAEQFKNEGNTFLAQGRYAEAIEKYSSAIGLNSQSAIYYTNRAVARINMRNWKDAASDCKAAIKCDASYAKAHYRLGQAFSGMENHSDAIDSYETAVELTRNDPAMNQTIKEQLEAERIKLNPSSSSMDDSEGGFDFASLMNNPALAGLASQLGGGGAAGGEGGLDFNALLSNPMIQQMASSMFGGAGAGAGAGAGGFNFADLLGGGAGTGASPQASNPTAQATDNSPSISSIVSDIRTNGQSAIIKHLSNSASRQKLLSFIQPDVEKSDDPPLKSAFDDIKENGIMKYISNSEIISKLGNILKTAISNHPQ